MSVGIMEKIEEIQSVSAKVNHKETRVIREIPVGKAVRQGDLYVRRIDKVPSNYTVETHKLQLVSGSTKGAQHFVEKTPSMKLFVDPSNKDALAGPCIISREEVHIRHPEHANFKLPAGIYQITYQRDFAYEERKRVSD